MCLEVTRLVYWDYSNKTARPVLLVSPEEVTGTLRLTCLLAAVWRLAR